MRQTIRTVSAASRERLEEHAGGWSPRDGARRLRVLSIAGTRPEAIKFAPLIHALAERPGIASLLVATGQHRALFHEALEPFGLSADVDLALPNHEIDSFCAALRQATARLIDDLAPDLILVQGDTSSAWAAAQAAAALGVPVGHVEAGLRSGDPDLPWPEERNRREIDALSSLLFAPTPAAVDNLADARGEVHLTGNTGIDALLWMRSRQPPLLHDSMPRLILVTCHRREALFHLPAVADALLAIAERPDVRLHLPLHPNPAVAPVLTALLGRHPRILLEPALPYPALVRMLDAAHLLLTDSGGLQEEAPALGLPTLVLREVTERPESIACGTARLVGLNPRRIVGETLRLLDNPSAHAAMAVPAFPYGRGDAARRIVTAIESWCGRAVEAIRPAL